MNTLYIYVYIYTYIFIDVSVHMYIYKYISVGISFGAMFETNLGLASYGSQYGLVMVLELVPYAAPSWIHPGPVSGAYMSTNMDPIRAHVLATIWSHMWPHRRAC